MMTEFKGINTPFGRSLSRLYGSLRKLDKTRKQWKPSVRPKTKTISVGNITVGGTGKTPFVSYLANHYEAQGLRVALLLRGYLGQEKGPAPVEADDSSRQFGDEAIMLARRGHRVWVSRKRELAIAHLETDTDLLILDDGFQRSEIERDMDLITFGSQGIGNGRLLPAGILRDPLTSLTRADVFVGRKQDIPPVYPEIPRIECGYQALTFSSTPFTPATPVAGLAAIAYPNRFFDALSRQNLNLCCRFPLPDHDPLLPVTLKRIAEQAERDGARAFIASEKDSVKLPDHVGSLPVVIARAEWGPLSSDAKIALHKLIRARTSL